MCACTSKTRLAPTPSGYLHLGNVLSFSITAALARKMKASILLRIDDLDRERAQREYVQDIFDTLHYMEIPWDEGPRDLPEFEGQYSQLHRMDLYREALETLKQGDRLFACNCSRTKIAKRGADGGYPGTCIHKKIPFDQKDVSWRLLTGGETVTAFPPSMQHFIVRKKDGFPAYQLTSVVDDQYFGVDLVVRGLDLLPSTQAQVYLAQYLPGNKFPHAVFHHHALLQDKDGIKLSKSAGATSIRYLRQTGKCKEDIYSLIAGIMGYKGPVANFEELAAAAGSRASVLTRPDFT